MKKKAIFDIIDNLQEKIEPKIEKENDININWIWEEYKRIYQLLGDDNKYTQVRIKLLENLENLLNKYKTILDEEKKIIETYSIYDILLEFKNIFKQKQCLHILQNFLKELLSEIENEIGETNNNTLKETAREVVTTTRKPNITNTTDTKTT